jgi:hypothetical protein
MFSEAFRTILRDNTRYAMSMQTNRNVSNRSRFQFLYYDIRDVIGIFFFSYHNLIASLINQIDNCPRWIFTIFFSREALRKAERHESLARFGESDPSSTPRTEIQSHGGCYNCKYYESLSMMTRHVSLVWRSVDRYFFHPFISRCARQRTT